MTFAVTNTGGAALHISSSATGGNNPEDFVTTASACVSAALTANASCAISVMPAGTGSTTATVSPGSSAQYQLQVMPGPNYSGTIAMPSAKNSAGQALQLPAIQVTLNVN